MLTERVNFFVFCCPTLEFSDLSMLCRRVLKYYLYMEVHTHRKSLHTNRLVCKVLVQVRGHTSTNTPGSRAHTHILITLTHVTISTHIYVAINTPRNTCLHTLMHVLTRTYSHHVLSHSRTVPIPHARAHPHTLANPSLSGTGSKQTEECDLIDS